MGADCCSSKKQTKEKTYENDLNDMIGDDLTASSTGMFGGPDRSQSNWKYQDDLMDKYI